MRNVERPIVAVRVGVAVGVFGKHCVMLCCLLLSLHRACCGSKWYAKGGRTALVGFMHSRQSRVSWTSSMRTTSTSATQLFQTTSASKKLGLLTFDLDDTLFPTSQVVQAANDAMIAQLQDYGCVDANIPDFIATTKSIRRKLDQPITYQNLRKAAIRRTLQEAPISAFDESMVNLSLIHI